MDLYQQLGVKRGASDAEIKKAYRSLAKQLHPDRNKDNPKAAERFGKITQAYDILSDKDRRAKYDRGEIDEDGNLQFGVCQSLPFRCRVMTSGRLRPGRPGPSGPGSLQLPAGTVERFGETSQRRRRALAGPRCADNRIAL